LTYYKAFAADILLYAVTLTFDLWLWTITAYRLWRGETLYQIWTQSSNPRRSYSDFGVWPYNLITLNIALRVELGSGIIFTKFHIRRSILAWIMACFMLIHYVTLWPWSLSRWPWNSVVHQASHDQSLYEI